MTTIIKLSEIQEKMARTAFTSLQTKYSFDEEAWGTFIGCLQASGFFETPEVPKPTSTRKTSKTSTGEKKYSGWLLYLNQSLKEGESQKDKMKNRGEQWKALGKEGQKPWNERAKSGEKPPTKSSKTTVTPAPAPAPTVPKVTPVPAMVSAAATSTVPPVLEGSAPGALHLDASLPEELTRDKRLALLSPLSREGRKQMNEIARLWEEQDTQKLGEEGQSPRRRSLSKHPLNKGENR
jgi:hypothetical protein